ncbi:MAG: DUF368 domain-containing protein [Fusobacteriaceae bacterium]
MILLFFKGIGIGIANIMPGVSGGTLAVVFGVYDKLVDAIGNFITANKQKKFEYIKFALPLLVGAGAGILLFAKILKFIYINYPTPTVIGFMILIIPSIRIIVKGEKWSKQNLASMIFGGLLTFIFILLGIMYGDKDDIGAVIKVFTLSYGIKLFLCGAIASGAMIIPGISGSLLLLMIGEYFNVLLSINTSVEALFSLLKGTSNLSFFQTIFSDSFLNLYFFAVGMVLGIVLFSKLIDFMLKKQRSKTLFFIDGIVIVSLFQILINIFPNLKNILMGWYIY